MRNREKKKRRKSPDGYNLIKDPRSGNWIWRRVDRKTKRRVIRSTKTRNLKNARDLAKEYEDEQVRREHGLKIYDDWSKPIGPMLDAYVAQLESQAEKGRFSRKTLNTKIVRIKRVIAEWNIMTPAALDDLSKLNRHLEGLYKGGKSITFIRRSYQTPLRHFSRWLAGSRRHLDRDPLDQWELFGVIGTEEKARQREARRAFLPDEVARALLASDRLDKLHDRKVAQALVFKVLLITAPRVGSLMTRDVKDFDFDDCRITFGEDVKKKRKGRGALDDVTASEVARSLGSREEGPLFLSPKGQRLRQERLLDRWREAFGLGLVAELLTKESIEVELEVAAAINRALLTGKVRVNKGGNPNLVKLETRRRRHRLAKLVESCVDQIRDQWVLRMKGIDLHAFRKTHRTWAEASGVPPVLIDMQLGHAAPEEPKKLMAFLMGSATGRAHYLDTGVPLFDPARSAEAVRKLLDEAIERVSAEVTVLSNATLDEGQRRSSA